LIGLVFFGPLAFGLGWLYAECFGPGSITASSSNRDSRSSEAGAIQVAAKLSELKQLLEQGLISTTDYEEKKTEILSRV
jgi:hypothetical protein